jgi:hypothetical protein
MSASRSTSTRSRASTGAFADRVRTALIDRLMDEYVSWREECFDVSAACGRWRKATSDEQSRRIFTRPGTTVRTLHDAHEGRGCRGRLPHRLAN